jgi:hypothetical protein
VREKARARLDRVKRLIGGLPLPGELSMLVCTRVDDGTGPGFYYNVDRRVATPVDDGPEPDPVIVASLEARLAHWVCAS